MALAARPENKLKVAAIVARMGGEWHDGIAACDVKIRGPVVPYEDDALKLPLYGFQADGCWETFVHESWESWTCQARDILGPGASVDQQGRNGGWAAMYDGTGRPLNRQDVAGFQNKTIGLYTPNHDAQGFPSLWNPHSPTGPAGVVPDASDVDMAERILRFPLLGMVIDDARSGVLNRFADYVRCLITTRRQELLQDLTACLPKRMRERELRQALVDEGMGEAADAAAIQRIDDHIAAIVGKEGLDMILTVHRGGGDAPAIAATLAAISGPLV